LHRGCKYSFFHEEGEMRANGHYLRFVLGCDQAGLRFSEAQQALFLVRTPSIEKKYSYLREVLHILHCDITAVHAEYFSCKDADILYQRVLSAFAALQRGEHITLQTEIEPLLVFFFDEFRRRLSVLGEERQLRIVS
jgi:hypothetical protein